MNVNSFLIAEPSERVDSMTSGPAEREALRKMPTSIMLACVYGLKAYSPGKCVCHQQR
jgi:hypothetical protein